MQLKKIKNYYDQLIRIDKHKNYLWDRIYKLRGEITDYVLINHNRRDVDKHWKALKVKAKLIQKYSLKLRGYDSIRMNEDFKEI